MAKLENNLMTISLQTLVNIANVLHMDINDLLCEERPAEDETSQDAFLSGLVHSLSPVEKAFVIHMINGMKRYQPDE